MYLSFPNSLIICVTICLITLGGDNSREGSKLPCNVILLFVSCLATLGLIVQSTPKAEALHPQPQQSVAQNGRHQQHQRMPHRNLPYRRPEAPGNHHQL